MRLIRFVYVDDLGLAAWTLLGVVTLLMLDGICTALYGDDDNDPSI